MSYLVLKPLVSSALRSRTVVASLIKTGVGLGETSVCGLKQLIKIKWKRPDPVPFSDPRKSGDQVVDIPPLQLDKPTLEYEKCETLHAAPENVKKVFSCAHKSRKSGVERVEKEYIDKMKRHELDVNSREVNITRLTVKVRALQEHHRKNPTDKWAKVVLKEMIEKRNKYLRLLRTEDYKKFEWVLEELNIVFRPGPTILNNVWRKESIRRLVDKHNDDVKTKRLAELRNQLNEEKINFLKKKAQFLEHTLTQEKKYGRTPSVTEEQINEVWKQYEELAEKNMERYEPPKHYHQFA